ncbi:hypothetical protein, partial [Pseudomonas sp. MWU16-30323]|uniref:hypothetical protein n=1 Tax=Pseudomonas sp. MWU16-30323 TaxID=2878094 RepID=UPI001CFB7DB8
PQTTSHPPGCGGSTMNIVIPLVFTTLFIGAKSPVPLRGTGEVVRPITVLRPYNPYSQSLAQS